MTGQGDLILRRQEAEVITELRERIGRLSEGLAAESIDESLRAPLRDELVNVVREIDALMGELAELRESVRPLADRYKSLFPRRAGGSGSAPPTRIDHLAAASHREKGWSALASGEYAEAERSLRHAVELDPEDHSAAAMLAWSCLELERSEESRDVLERVLARDPEHALAKVVLGYERVREEDFGAGIRELSAAASLTGDRTATLYAHLFLGVAYAARGMHRDAQTFFRRALELGPNLTEAYWRLGLSHQAEGQLDLAAEAWRAGGENRFNSWGERCRVALAELEGERLTEP